MADVATHKMVDGILVELTSVEATAIEAEWAANLAKPKLDAVDSFFKGNAPLAAVLEAISQEAGIDIEKVKAVVRAKLAQL